MTTATMTKTKRRSKKHDVVFPLVNGIFLCVLMFVLHHFNFGGKKSLQKTLKVTIPENLSYEEALNEVFHNFNVPFELKKIRTTELGSLYELVYIVTVHESVNQKQFLYL